MKGNIRNRKTVASVMTKTRLAGGNPDKAFSKKVESRMLYHKFEHLTIQSANKKSPQPRFSRVKLGPDQHLWCPVNPAGEEYLTSLSEEARNKFVYHANPIPSDEPKPESRRIVECRPIKALPNGHRESDYFPSESAFAAPKRSTKYVEPEPKDIPDAEVAKIRAAISAGTFS